MVCREWLIAWRRCRKAADGGVARRDVHRLMKILVC